jgi:ectoine hydroxylase-related dioxygenase (phytanoyl-CoA dioxygenase family)
MSRMPQQPGKGLEPEPDGWTEAQVGAHMDNGNNSLLPPTLDRRHSQIIFWFNLEDVEADQAPTVMWPTQITASGPVADMDQPAPFIAPGGSLCIFHNYTMHAASSYRRQIGRASCRERVY